METEAGAPAGPPAQGLLPEARRGPLRLPAPLPHPLSLCPLLCAAHAPGRGDTAPTRARAAAVSHSVSSPKCPRVHIRWSLCTPAPVCTCAPLCVTWGLCQLQAPAPRPPPHPGRMQAQHLTRLPRQGSVCPPPWSCSWGGVRGAQGCLWSSGSLWWPGGSAQHAVSTPVVAPSLLCPQVCADSPPARPPAPRKAPCWDRPHTTGPLPCPPLVPAPGSGLPTAALLGPGRRRGFSSDPGAFSGE